MPEDIQSCYPLEINRSCRAKRMSLKVKKDMTCFVLTLPEGASLKKARQFVDMNSGWLIKAAYHLRKPVKIQDGTEIPLLGEKVTVFFRQELSYGVHRDGNHIYVSCKPEHFARCLKNYMQKELLSYIMGKIKIYSLNYPLALPIFKGGRLGKVSIHCMSSRWGSCSADGNISFCFNLCFAEHRTIDYVIAHELAHLKEMNHSEKFWNTVAYMYPSWQSVRQNLKRNGSILHSFVF